MYTFFLVVIVVAFVVVLFEMCCKREHKSSIGTSLALGIAYKFLLAF